jgi:hypothetical protein
MIFKKQMQCQQKNVENNMVRVLRKYLDRHYPTKQRGKTRTGKLGFSY